MLLFPAARASVQNLVTSVILDGSVQFAYHFVVLFFYSRNSLSSTFPSSDLLVFRTTVGFPTYMYKPQSFHISLHFVLNSNSSINFMQLSYKSFLCRPNRSQRKLCQRIDAINFNCFSKIPPWLEMVGRKIGRMQRDNSACLKFNSLTCREFANVQKRQGFKKTVTTFPTSIQIDCILDKNLQIYINVSRKLETVN